jgi:hypothetical protein
MTQNEEISDLSALVLVFSLVFFFNEVTVLQLDELLVESFDSLYTEEFIETHNYIRGNC